MYGLCDADKTFAAHGSCSAGVFTPDPACGALGLIQEEIYMAAIEYRKLTDADYPDIIDICKDIWDGTDYLPELFHKWVDDLGMFLGAVDMDSNKVVGVDKYSILHDGSGWLEGLRVHKDYRGTGLGKGLALKTLGQAMQDLHKGIIRRIGFSTHITAVESIGLMKKLNFRLKQEYIFVLKEYENLNPGISADDFVIEEWEISYEEFKNQPYIRRRNNILPFVFYFQEPTPELFQEFKEDGCFVIINGYKGMFKLKGEPHFICFDESFEAIDTFMNYYLLILNGKNPTPPLTSVKQEDGELISSLKSAGYSSWNDWKCDYLYFIYDHTCTTGKPK